MVETGLGALAFLVFGVLWLSSQDWFDLLPRRAVRRIAAAGTIALFIAVYAAPTAFQAGFQRFVDHAAAKATKQVQDGLREVADRTVGEPAPPEPAPT